MKAMTLCFWTLVFVGLSVSVGAFAQFSGGTGTAANPFQIKTADDLNNVRNYIGSSHADKHFRLMNDIDLTAFLQNYNEGWLPIGDNSNKFTGYFHGKGYRVNGLWMNRLATDYVGFFGVNAGTIDSLTIIIDSKGIYGNNNIGGLSGHNTGTISQCRVSEGSITAKGNYIGSLVGMNNSAITQSCSVNTTVWGNNEVGGLVGYNTTAYGYYNTKVHQCYAQNTTVGGNYVGGLVGLNETSAAISQSYSAGVVSGGNSIGGLLGRNSGATITGCYYDEEVSEQYNGLGNPSDSQNNNIKAKNTSEMMKQKTFLAWDFVNVWKIDETVSYPYFQWEGEAQKVNIESVSLSRVKIYPNPTDGIIYVECEIHTPVKIYNLSGRVLYQTVAQSGKETIDLNDYPAGLYLIKAGYAVQRVIKK